MAAPKSRPQPGEFTGRHMLIIMLAFFGVIITVNLTMAVIAGRSWTGLVVPNSYVASQNFNEELAEAARQNARGWRSALAYRDGAIQFDLQDRDGEPIILSDMQAAVGRPAFEQDDRRVALTHTTSGRYRAELPLDVGVWTVRITGGSGEMAYRRDARLNIKSGDAAKPAVAN